MELADKEKLPVLRAHFRRWRRQSAALTTVASPGAPDEEIMQAAPMRSVFKLEEEAWLPPAIRRTRT